MDGPNLVNFRTETKSGNVFKGVALGVVEGLSTGEFQVKGQVLEVQGRCVMLASARLLETNLPYCSYSYTARGYF